MMFRIRIRITSSPKKAAPIRSEGRLGKGAAAVAALQYSGWRLQQLKYGKKQYV